MRLLLALLLTAAVLAAASGALFVTGAPAPVSLVVEPFSLLFMPGMLISMAVTRHSNEVSAGTVVLASACFYFILFSLLLLRVRRDAHAHSRSR